MPYLGFETNRKVSTQFAFINHLEKIKYPLTDTGSYMTHDC